MFCNKQETTYPVSKIEKEKTHTPVQDSMVQIIPAVFQVSFIQLGAPPTHTSALTHTARYVKIGFFQDRDAHKFPLVTAENGPVVLPKHQQVGSQGCPPLHPSGWNARVVVPQTAAGATSHSHAPIVGAQWHIRGL